MKTFKRTLSERKEKRWRLSAAQYKKDPPPLLLPILPSFSRLSASVEFRS